MRKTWLKLISTFVAPLALSAICAPAIAMPAATAGPTAKSGLNADASNLVTFRRHRYYYGEPVVTYYARPVYQYAPPPVVYYPPPVVYYPAPVIVERPRPPAVVYDDFDVYGGPRYGRPYYTGW